jgi:hypothetical protein
MKKFGLLISDLVIAALFAACVTLLVKSHQERKALDECVDDITNKCASIFNYATALEKENAKLNRLIRECRNDKNW